MCRFLALLTTALAVVLGMSSSAVARQRFPVIGCIGYHSEISPNHDSWRYAPTNVCEIGGQLGSAEGIDDAHWQNWGQPTATAQGFLIDGLGFDYPADITAYRLYTCHNCFGKRGATYSWYERLHVVASAAFRGMVWRGPFDEYLNVVPTEPLTRCPHQIRTPPDDRGVWHISKRGTSCAEAYKVARSIQRRGFYAFRVKRVRVHGVWRVSWEQVYDRKLAIDPFALMTCRRGKAAVTFYMGS